MQIQTLSVVVGGSACNATCQYCVSKLTGCTAGVIQDQKPMEINKRNFNIACNFAKQSGVSTVLLTGKGEPLIYQNHITRYLEMLEKWQFPFVELQTNGILLTNMKTSILKMWYDAGLTTISLSCAHWMPSKNKDILGQDTYMARNISKLHKIGFAVRISCVMVDGYVDNLNKVIQFINWCKCRGVEQFTIRPVGNVSAEEAGDDEVKNGVRIWIDDHSKFKKSVWQVEQWLDKPENATRLLTLAHGAKVYDVKGQNISWNSCLTRSDNPDDMRQLIFSSDGHLRYDWVKQGAILI
jgi:molybdenum cofactor biosynthesis enzyme MoaA